MHMSNAIRFLERLAGEAAWGGDAMPEYAAAVDALDVDDEQKRLLLARDPEALNRLLGGRAMMAMHVAVPDGGEPEQAPERRDDDEKVPEDEPRPEERPE